MLGGPGLAEVPTAGWGQTEAQENPASPTEPLQHPVSLQRRACGFRSFSQPPS